ncbi:sulfatase-like hydrolase/transferase [Pseudochrobactrum sp. Wa41.01b-1]|uniref:sulfatase-like hydrolase/transferase n=1 Tax=Pseudochrobactrum sp. Wa41.01b-1 TaxID=2864102 RepID=UPI001C68C4BA|nr:sulfatase-like hydrolase/transferase [Pseudochrobactrum sp. Wa41.01b-1]QYM73332.1 sulfatase-like hydrolase/transferase [Pseudochrobactrum sp. Wa41.01b-1]
MQNIRILSLKNISSTSKKQIWPTSLFALLTIAAFIAISFSWKNDDILSVNYNSVIFSAVLCLIFFKLLLLLFSPLLCFSFILILAAIIRHASNIKEENTNEPLIYGDISHINHIGLALKFIPTYALILGLISLLLISTILIKQAIKRKKNKTSLKIIILSLITLTIYSSGEISSLIIKQSKNFGIKYYSWDWKYNALENGLLIHLLQTSLRPNPVKLTRNQTEEFTNYIKRSAITIDAPKLFINILCEACWYDEHLLKNSFQPLIELGGIEMRGISPIFGGGTPNASIEMLTGLPIVNPALSGVVYQEYRDFITNETSTLPAHLLNNGIRTFSAHNYTKKFWFREAVEPKLGFEAFFGIEDMNPEDRSGDWYPRDTILYNFTLQEILKLNNERAFINLATVYTHGPFEELDNDGGITNYQNKIDTAINDIVDFIKKVKTVEPGAVFLIYGDHKPYLKATENYKSLSRHDRGDMPVLIIDPNIERAKKLKVSTNKKPFYCYATSVSSIYYGMKLPIGKYTDDVCDAYKPDDYEILSRSIPAWVYSAALFNKTMKH